MGGGTIVGAFFFFLLAPRFAEAIQGSERDAAAAGVVIFSGSAASWLAGDSGDSGASSGVSAFRSAVGHSLATMRPPPPPSLATTE